MMTVFDSYEFYAAGKIVAWKNPKLSFQCMFLSLQLLRGETLQSNKVSER